MLTGGQLSSLSTGAGAASPTACDFEPNSSLNREPSDGLESEEALLPNMLLPPPQPDNSAPAAASASATHRWRARPAAAVRIISLLRIRMYPQDHQNSGAPLQGARGSGL